MFQSGGVDIKTNLPQIKGHWSQHSSVRHLNALSGFTSLLMLIHLCVDKLFQSNVEAVRNAEMTYRQQKKCHEGGRGDNERWHSRAAKMLRKLWPHQCTTYTSLSQNLLE